MGKRHLVQLDYAEDIVEAICQQFDYDENIKAYCLAQLCNTNDASIRCFASQELHRMKRCDRCGEKTETVLNREYHDECGAFEEFVDEYCPYCDLALEES